MQRSPFAGGDQRYLLEEQYRGSERLAARANLHAKYSTAATPWFDWVHHRLALATGVRVLEVGCGAGWLWERSTVAVPADVHLTLVDLSPGMVEEALARTRDTGRFASVDGQPADAQEFPFADAGFDVVIANHMLYHLPAPERGVDELARVLAPAGRAVVATNGRRHMAELWRIRATLFESRSVDETVDVFGIETGFPILRDRFASVRWDAYADELRCTDPVDVVDYLCSIPPADSAGPDVRDRIHREVDGVFAANDGVMTITKDTGCFTCTGPLNA